MAVFNGSVNDIESKKNKFSSFDIENPDFDMERCYPNFTALDNVVEELRGEIADSADGGVTEEVVDEKIETAIQEAYKTEYRYNWEQNKNTTYPLGWKAAIYNTSTNLIASSTNYIMTRGYLTNVTLGNKIVFTPPSGWGARVIVFNQTGAFVTRYGEWAAIDKPVTVDIVAGYRYYFAIGKFSGNASSYLTQDFIDQISLICYTDKIGDLTNRVAVVEEKAVTPTVKILGIGNSYTRDSLRWLCKILNSAGYNAVVGHGYWGGSTLADQYESLTETSTNHTIFQYWKYNNSPNAETTDGMSLDTILKDETWDIVIFQQQSDNAGQYNSFVSASFDINDFISYIKNAISNPNLKIGITATWSHASGYSGENFNAWYEGNPETQYNAIQTVIPQVANHMSQCDFIINTGKAVKLGRENEYLGAIGVELLRDDKTHLAYGIPSFMASMVYAITLLGIHPANVSFYPTVNDDSAITTATSAYLAYLAKQCALQASQTSTIDDIETALDKIIEIQNELIGSTETVETITFTIDDVSYTAEKGMTWGEWVDSEYNTGGFVRDDSMYESDGVILIIEPTSGLYISETVIEDGEESFYVVYSDSEINDGYNYAVG